MPTELLAWVWEPLVFYAVFLGVGLLADAVVRARLPAPLIPALGMAIAVVAATVGFRLVPALVLPVLLVLAVAGFVAARRELRERCWAPPALLAAVLVYGLYMAPIVLSGEATWGGYNFVNDTASNFILTQALEQSGTAIPTDVSGFSQTTAGLLRIGYPLGSFSLLAGLRPLSGVPVEAAYQPAMALFAALGAMSLTELARRSGLRPAATVVAGVLPMGGVLLYRYVLHGSIKEIALATLCMVAVAIAVVAVERRLPARLVVLLAAVAAAMALVFSLAALAFVGALAVATLAAAFLSPNRPDVRHVAKLIGIAAGLGLVALIPVLGSALDFADTIRKAFASSGGDPTAQFGQLVRQLPVTEASGVWISRDYRYPADSPFNDAAVVAALLAFAAGVATCVWQRLSAPLVLLATLLIPALVLSPFSSVYIDGKLLVLLTPGVVFVAVLAGLKGLDARSGALKALGAVGLAAVAAGVLASDLYSYREANPAPIDRMEALKDAGANAPGDGLYLFNEWEEYGKFFLRAARVNPASEAQSPHPVELRRDAPVFGRWFDLDRHELGYVQQFDGVIVRRSPAASRPPASFRLVHRNDYYEVWRKDSGTRVAEHLPLQSRDRAAAVPVCRDVLALARRVRPGERLVAAERPRVARLSPLLARKPGGWPPSADAKGTVTPRGPGEFSGTLTAAGTQRVWLRASTVRALRVYVDGRFVGTADAVNTPDQWYEVGTVRLGSGSHAVEVRRGRRTWRPGDSAYGNVGPVALETVGKSRLVGVDPRAAQTLCGRPWDWIERVRGG